MKSGRHEDLLRYYKDELTYLRRMGGEFARTYPRVAERLELGRDECADPQVERLIESFAFLSARLQRDLDGQLPDVTTALLGVLYPQLVNPVPSMAVARFDVDPGQGKLTTGHTVNRGTRLFAEAGDGVTCRFRTCYPVTLWPLKVTHASFVEPWRFNFLDTMTEVASVLRVSLNVLGGGSLEELELKRLRFYLNADAALANTLYELLFCHARGVALMPEGEQQPVRLPQDSIRPVGFGPEEGVLPYPPQSHRGYRLLQEYFSFPEKFLFFDLDNLDRLRRGKTLDVLFLLDRAPAEQLGVHAETFALGCTPVINLFQKTTEPIRLDHRSLEYRLVPDKRRERTTEVHSILSVSASSTTTDERARQFEPFYSYNHAMDGAGQKAFWHLRREHSLNRDIPGTEVYLSFLDLDFKPTRPPAEVVYAQALCTNRELATQLPADAELQTEELAPLLRISCLAKPTQPVQPHLRGASLWRLVSHLSLNHLSLSEGSDSLAALREILKLYASSDRPSTQQQIAGMVGLKCRKVMRRMGLDAWRGFCRGTEVTVEFDEKAYVGSGAFLLAAVLDKFFALYASINSFTQLRAVSRQREGVWREWPPSAGEKIIL